MSREKGELMKITWLGQAGLLFDNGETKIMVDPYLSHSVEKVNPQNFRRVPPLWRNLPRTPGSFTNRRRKPYLPRLWHSPSS